jgi:alkanesulfonate monooxygenase SsuD/methylene tetrahydromethanopterin reductase-like flavin-dependent oxidoreductase (luciferase family)
MRIGAGLPNPVPGTPARSLVEWAARAERLGFASVATIDRVAFPGHEPLTCLAAAAVATERVELMTNVVLAPTRAPALLAKAAATVDGLSGGRLTLGLAVGGREDDYALTGRAFAARGRAFDALLADLHAAWRGEPPAGAAEPVAPAPVRPGGIPILVGGASERALGRAARWGAGWTAGGSGPDEVADGGRRLRSAWAAAGRAGRPRVVALAYYALGREGAAGLDAYLRRYYAYLGALTGTARDRELAGTSAGATTDPVAALVDAVPRDAGAIRALAAAYEAAGADDLVLCPVSADAGQLEGLAGAIL